MSTNLDDAIKSIAQGRRDKANKEAAEIKDRGAGVVGDAAIGLGKGALQVPDILAGVADIVPGLFGADRPVSKLTDAIGETTGFQPKKWAEESNYSPKLQRQIDENQARWDDEDSSAGELLQGYLKNPALISNFAAESAVPTLAGGVLGKIAKSFAVGEGAVIAGSAMSGIDKDVDPQVAAGSSLLQGVLGGIIGKAGGSISDKLGVLNPDNLLSYMTANGVSQKAAQKVLERTPINKIKQLIYGTGIEGGEEAAQSLFETGLSNLAEGKPFSENLSQNVVEGSIAGAGMGGAINLAPRKGIFGRAVDKKSNKDALDTKPGNDLLNGKEPPKDDQKTNDFDIDSGNQLLKDQANKSRQNFVDNLGFTDIRNTEIDDEANKALDEQIQPTIEQERSNDRDQPVRNNLPTSRDGGGVPEQQQEEVQPTDGRNNTLSEESALNEQKDPTQEESERTQETERSFAERRKVVENGLDDKSIDSKKANFDLIDGYEQGDILLSSEDGGKRERYVVKKEDNKNGSRTVTLMLEEYIEDDSTWEEVPSGMVIITKKARNKGYSKVSGVVATSYLTTSIATGEKTEHDYAHAGNINDSNNDPGASLRTNTLARELLELTSNIEDEQDIQKAMSIMLDSGKVEASEADKIILVAKNIIKRSVDKNEEQSKNISKDNTDTGTSINSNATSNKVTNRDTARDTGAQGQREQETQTNVSEATAPSTEGQGVKIDQAKSVLPNQGTDTSSDDSVDAGSQNEQAISSKDKEVNTNPSETQKEAGNYKKAHKKISGLDISIENPVGSTRSGKDPDGKSWATKMKSAYGYIKGTVGHDKDHVDIFLGDSAETATRVFVVDQIDPKTGKFDEHKVMMGYADEASATQAYNDNYDKGWKGLAAVTEMAVPEFKEWVKDKAKTNKPASKVNKPNDSNQVEDKNPEIKNNIQDFGEVLQGAKKHTYTFSKALEEDIDVKSVPLSKSFPSPDYKKMANDGLDPVLVATIAQLRADIKPKSRKRVKDDWIDSVTNSRSLTNALMDGDFLKPEDIFSKQPNDYRFEIAQLSKEILPEQIKELANFKLSKQRYSFFLGKKNVTKWEVFNFKTKGSESIYSNFGDVNHFDTQQDALDYIKLRITDTNKKTGKAQTKFDIWSERGKPGVFLGKKVASRKFIQLKRFDTAKEAREYKDTHQEELVELLAKKKKIRAIRRIENNPRVGIDYRNGKNVTPELFTDTFGFRGVQFGNWVEGGRRQEDLNNAYDGLLDMADLLNIPPKAISLNGTLGLAFGARGSGGKNSAAAHYESGRVNINLTKISGRGSLAHEWFHALDNYFGKADKGEAFLTEGKRNKRKAIQKDGRTTIVDTTNADFEVRKEVYDAWVGLTKAIKKETKLAERSKQLDKLRTKNYWSTVREMTARSFERYVIDKLADKGFESDYLANIVSEPAHDAENEILGSDQDYPYPLESEMEAVNKAYDALFKVLKTKETDKGVALFSKSDATTGSTKAHIESLLPKRVKRLVQQGKLKVVQSLNEISGNAYSFTNDTGVEGYYDLDNDTLYLVADKLDKSNLNQVLNHELYHRARATDKKLQSQLKALDKQLQKRFDLAGKGIGTKAEKDAYKRVMDANTPVKDQLEEFQAYLVSIYNTKPESLSATVRKWITDLFAAIRAALIRQGVTPKNITSADLNALARYGSKVDNKSDKVANDSVLASEDTYERIYSQLKRAIQRTPDRIFKTGKQTSKWLTSNAPKLGIKADELYWSGIYDWLEMQDKLTKADVVNYLDDNGVKVETVVLGGRGDVFLFPYKTEARLKEQIGDDRELVNKDGSLKKDLEIAEEADGWHLYDSSTTNAKHDNDTLTLPGGKDYQELVVTIPTTGSFNKDDETHFGDVGEGKQIAWIRHNTRGDSLFLEEIQSQRGQEGRGRGFRDEYTAKEVTDPAEFSFQTVYDIFDSRGNKVASEAPGKTPTKAISEWIIYSTEDDNVGAVPPAPFVTDSNNKATNAYISLLLKQAISHAIDNGQTSVSWTTGDQQADRYDLSKQISRITYTKAKVLRAYDNDGSVVLNKKLNNDSEVDAYIGKESAKKLLSKDMGKVEVDKTSGFFPGRELAGLDLKVGGEWTKAMYGDSKGMNANGDPSLIMQAARTIAKKMGGKIGSIELNTGEQPALIITDKMKAKILKEGLPLFSKAPSSFKKWFGKSKMKAKGDPIVFYHGTNADFTVFDSDKLKSSTLHSTAELGHFFTRDKAEAQGYGSKVNEVVLKIENPYVVTSEILDKRMGDNIEKFKEGLIARGHDGIYIKDAKYAIVFDSSQAKLTSNESPTNDPDIRFSYAGKKAKTADSSALAKAVELDKSGVDNETIRKDTGWFLGMDDQWRFEIDDGDFYFKEPLKPNETLHETGEFDIPGFNEDGYATAEEYEKEFQKLWAKKDRTKEEEAAWGKIIEQKHFNSMLENGSLTLGTLFDENQPVFKAYPELNSYKIRIADLGGNTRGSFSNKLIEISNKVNPNDIEWVVIHELQHAIQDIEGFARGGSPTDFPIDSGKGVPSIEKRYQTLKDIHRLSIDLNKTPKEVLDSGAIDSKDVAFLKGRSNSDIDYIIEEVFKKALNENDQVKLYKHLAGEIEARDTQDRLGLTGNERKAKTPYQSQGISKEDAIVRFKGGAAQSVKFSKSKKGTNNQWRNEKGYEDVTDAQFETLGKFGSPEETIDLKDEVKKRTHLWKTKSRQYMVDQYDSFRSILKDDTAWMMAGLSGTGTNVVESAITKGRPKLDKSGAIDVDVSQKSVAEILEPLGDEVNRFLQWIAGNRAATLKEEGKENLLNDKDISNLIGLANTPERKALYEKTRVEFEAMHNAIVKIGVDTGLVSKEDAKIWREQGFYVPFYRLSDESNEGHGAQSVSGLVRQNAYKKLKGADMQLNDLLTNVLMNWEHIAGASLKNQTASKALKTAFDLELATPIHEKQKDKNSVFVRENGKEIWYRLDDSQEGQLVLESLTSLNYDGLNTPTMKAMRSFKRALTFGVTASPEFKIANLIRDSIGAVAINDMSTQIHKNLYKGFKSTAENSELGARGLASGARFGSSGYIHGSDPEAKKIAIAKGMKSETNLDSRSKFKKVWDSYEAWGNRFENVNRMASFEQDLAKGKTLLEAAFNARDQLAFDRTGSAVAVRALGQIVPFLNARLQGLDKLARAGTDPKQRKQFTAVVGVYSMASVLLYMAMKDDDDYKEAEQWERDTYHLFKLPNSDIMYRIPRPFEVGAMANMAERFVEQITDDEAHGELFLERLAHTLTETFAMSPVPQMFKPAIELWANKSSFTGRNIESQSMKRLSPEERKRVWTSQTAIGLSQGMSSILWDDVTLSPVQIEHLVNAYVGWLGGFALASIDNIVSRPLAGSPERPTRALKDYPVIGRFVREGKGRNSRFVTEFYKNQKKINRYYGDIRAYRENKEFEKLDAAMKKHKDELSVRKYYNRVSKNISRINRNIRLITKGSGSPQSKRLRIDRLNRRRINLARNAVERLSKKNN